MRKTDFWEAYAKLSLKEHRPIKDQQVEYADCPAYDETNGEAALCCGKEP
jgi:hypothetical protein